MKQNKKGDSFWLFAVVFILVILIGSVFLGRFIGKYLLEHQGFWGREEKPSAVPPILVEGKPTIALITPSVTVTETPQEVALLLPPGFGTPSVSSLTPGFSPTPQITSTPEVTPISNVPTTPSEVLEKPLSSTNTLVSSPIPTHEEEVIATPTNPSLPSVFKGEEDIWEQDKLTLEKEKNKLTDTELEEMLNQLSPSPTSTTTPKILYRIQAGLFLDRKNAQEVVEKLKQQGVPAVIVQLEREGKVLYRVQTGAFSSQSNAERMKEQLEKMNIEVFIVVEK